MGNKTVNLVEEKNCPICGGKGFVLKVILGNTFERIPCPRCKGGSADGCNSAIKSLQRDK